MRPTWPHQLNTVPRALRTQVSGEQRFCIFVIRRIGRSIAFITSIREAPVNNTSAETLRGRLQARTTLVGIVGLGYVGLPLASAITDSGFHVLGFDIDESKVAALQRGENYIIDVTSSIMPWKLRSVDFQATTDFARLNEPDVVILCVPTPLTDAREPDLQFVVGSTESVAACSRPGQLVILESTTYPGTTRDVVLPILARSGLEIGRDYFLAYAPERQDPGRWSFSRSTIPQVVGGVDEVSLELAAEFYSQFVKTVVRVSSCEVAEASKILENTYRAVNIALVNELKILYERMGINVWEVIDAAKTKPFGFQAFYPGPGLGGHCIPIDPFYLTWIARKYDCPTRFIELAGEVNTAMPAYVAGKIADALNERGKPMKGSKVLLLGMAYKEGVNDTRGSPGLALLDLLLKKGADASYNDPFVPVLPITRKYPHLRMSSSELTEATLQRQDAVVAVTDHSDYNWAWIVERSALVIDTRNATRRVTICADRIVRA
jgi:UDP-N-acetyl-D-glucosamine dehydrogenase